MIDQLKEWDEQLLLILNGLGHPHLDGVMIFLSAKLVWVPLYLGLIFLLYKHYGSAFWKPLILVIVAIALADQVTSSFMKPFFERLRPCTDSSLVDMLVIPKGCGGKFGFASSHAANTFALAIFYLQLSKTRWFWLLVGWAAMVSYSRVYLGVHYPGDILVGALVGSILGFISAKGAAKWLAKSNT